MSRHHGVGRNPLALDGTEGGELIESETLRVERPAYQRVRVRVRAKNQNSFDGWQPFSL